MASSEDGDESWNGWGGESSPSRELARQKWKKLGQVRERRGLEMWRSLTLAHLDRIDN